MFVAYQLLELRDDKVSFCAVIPFYLISMATNSRILPFIQYLSVKLCNLNTLSAYVCICIILHNVQLCIIEHVISLPGCMHI